MPDALLERVRLSDRPSAARGPLDQNNDVFDHRYSCVVKLPAALAIGSIVIESTSSMKVKIETGLNGRFRLFETVDLIKNQSLLIQRISSEVRFATVLLIEDTPYVLETATM